MQERRDPASEAERKQEAKRGEHRPLPAGPKVVMEVEPLLKLRLQHAGATRPLVKTANLTRRPATCDGKAERESGRLRRTVESPPDDLRATGSEGAAVL